MAECLKRTTKCLVITEDGTRYEATNDCDVEGLEVCPRVLAGVPDGIGYEICRSMHAEAIVAEGLPFDSRGVAYIYGHDWVCGPCQHALSDKGITRFELCNPRAPRG